uniref:Uncharacterized protein n=1 Tax=Ditylenchus dipsaci TaxID=166011 RepID=A0A915EHT3_9BILA
MDEDRCGEDREDFSPLLSKEGLSDNCPATVLFQIPLTATTTTTITNQPKLEDAEVSIGDCIIEKQNEFLPDLSQKDVYSSLIVSPSQQQTLPLSATPKKVTDIQTVANPIHCKDTSNFCCCPISSANFLPKSNRKGSIRYLILLLSILCMTATRSNDLSFNFTVICMTSNSSLNNDSPIHMKPRELSAIFAVILTLQVLPIVYALHYFGPRLVFGALLLLSASATFALPSLAKLSPLWMVPARIVQGLALSAVLPLMGCISAEWAPLSEIGKFMTLLSSAGQLSQILTMPLSAQLCVTAGWSSVFYTHGIISALLAGCFLFFYRSSPRKHPCVNAKELHYITQGAKAKNKKRGFWISIDYSIYAHFFEQSIKCAYCSDWNGYASDNITIISELTKLKFFNSMAMVGCGLFLLPLGFLNEGSDSMIPAMFCFTGSISCLGMVACSSMKSATLVARNFTHFVMGVVQLVVCVAMLAIPVLLANPAAWALPVTPHSLLNDVNNDLGGDEKRNISGNTTDIAPTATNNSSKYKENLAKPSDI